LLGSQLLINGHPFSIVGIAPRGFTGTMQVISPEVWLPLGVYDQVANDFASENNTKLGDRSGQQLILVGRLKPGMTAATAEPSLKGLASNLERAFPVEQKDQTFQTTPISRFSVSTSPSGEGGISRIARCSWYGNRCVARGMFSISRTCCWRAAPRDAKKSRFVSH
jgi:hypothetical protein